MRKPIEGFEDKYEIDTNGNIFSLTRRTYYDTRSHKVPGRKLKPWKDTRGYFQIYLCIDGKRYVKSIARLVLETFVGPSNGLTANHKNGVLTDNAVTNLEWLTQKENNNHAYRTGLMNPRKGVTHPKAKINMQIAREMRRAYLSKELNIRELAEKYNVSGSTVSQVMRCITWKEEN